MVVENIYFRGAFRSIQTLTIWVEVKKPLLLLLSVLRVYPERDLFSLGWFVFCYYPNLIPSLPPKMFFPSSCALCPLPFPTPFPPVLPLSSGFSLIDNTRRSVIDHFPIWWLELWIFLELVCNAPARDNLAGK